MFRYDFSRLPFVSMTGKVREGRGWSHNGRRMGVNMLVIIHRGSCRFTIGDYILEMRMRHAAYLLRNTYMNVNQAADYLGFSSASYFSRVFKQYYGVSPSAYFD